MEDKKKQSVSFSDYIKTFSKKCLFEKVLISFFAIFTLLFIVTFIMLYKAEQGSLTKSTVSIMSAIFSIYKLFVFLSIVDLCLIAYNRFFLCKDKSTIFMGAYILGAVGTLLAFMQNFKLTIYINFIKSLYGFSLKSIFSYGAKALTKFSQRTANFTFAFYILAIIMIIASILLFIVFITNYQEEKTSVKSDEETKASLDTAKKDIDKAIDASMDFVEKNAKVVKDAFESDEVKKAINTSKDTINKNKNKIIFSIVAVVVIIIAIFSFKTISYNLKPDAVVSMKNIKIQINVNGKDGFGKAKATVEGEPLVSEIKDPKKTSLIYSTVRNYDVKLDKESGLKNGDTVTATLTLKENANKSLKLKFDKKEITQSITVSNLEEIVNSIKDLDSTVRDRMDRKIKADIVQNISTHSKNLKLEKVKTYEKPMADADLENGAYTTFLVREIYKVSYESEKFTFSDKKEYEQKEEFYVYEFSNFKKKNNSVIFDVYRKDVRKSSDTVIEDLDNRYKIEGFKEEK